MTTKESSWLCKWAFLLSLDIPRYTSVCELFWRCTLNTALLPLFAVIAVSVGLALCFEWCVKKIMPRKRLGLGFLTRTAEYLRARKHKICPIIEIVP